MKAPEDVKYAFPYDLIESLPVIVSVNEVKQPGEITSLYNVWINPYGLTLLHYDQMEITGMGYDFFRQVIHPADLEIMPVCQMLLSGAEQEETVFEGTFRIRPKGEEDYHWVFAHCTAIERFSDGSPHRVLTASFNLSNIMHSGNQLLAALREINHLKNDLCHCCLSKREKEVLHLILKGLTDKEIAEKLFISFTTAKKHRTNLLHKFGVHKSAELAAIAVERGEDE